MTETQTLDRAALTAILAHARELHPEECCGAVIATSAGDEVRRFTNIQGRLHQENPADFPRDATTAYTPEPRELLDALRAGEQAGARLAIFYHSHSKNGAYFSGEDRARAMFDGDPAYPEVTYLVVSDAREPDEARAFRWNEAAHDFLEVELVVTGAAPVRSTAPRKPAAARTRAAAKPVKVKKKASAKPAKRRVVKKAAPKKPAKRQPPQKAAKKAAPKPRRPATKRARTKTKGRRRR